MELQEGEALGLVETRGLIAGIEACDAMLKAADVRLLGVEQTIPALITVKIAGETAAVRAACDAGAAAAERIGQVVAVHVIPRPGEGVRALLADGSRRPAASPIPGGSGARSLPGDLESLTVRELRELAREREDFPLQGRAISRATKEQLLDLLGG
jgi:ethanolamine utilization protein EutM